MSAAAVYIEGGRGSNGSDFAYSVQLYHAFGGWHRGVLLLDYSWIIHVAQLFLAVFNVKSV